MKALALDIGGTKIAAAAIDADGRILWEKKIATPADSWKLAKAEIAELARACLKSHPDIQVGGISSAGPLHAESGQLLSPTNLNWGDVFITSELEKEIGLPFLLENDAAAAVLGEYWLGEFKNSESLVMLTLGTGLGVGMIVNHQVVRGGRGFHPEGGHLVLEVNDPTALCGCGNTGCSEVYLSGSHFLRRARNAYHDPEMSIENVLQKTRSEDPLAKGLFENYSLRLAQMITNMIVMAYPYSIVLGGSFAQASSFFLPRTQEHLRRLLGRRPQSWLPKIGVSTLANAGLVGAAKLALRSQM